MSVRFDSIDWGGLERQFSEADIPVFGPHLVRGANARLIVKETITLAGLRARIGDFDAAQLLAIYSVTSRWSTIAEELGEHPCNFLLVERMMSLMRAGRGVLLSGK